METQISSLVGGVIPQTSSSLIGFSGLKAASSWRISFINSQASWISQAVAATITPIPATGNASPKAEPAFLAVATATRLETLSLVSRTASLIATCLPRYRTGAEVVSLAYCESLLRNAAVSVRRAALSASRLAFRRKARRSDLASSSTSRASRAWLLLRIVGAPVRDPTMPETVAKTAGTIVMVTLKTSDDNIMTIIRADQRPPTVLNTKRTTVRLTPAPRPCGGASRGWRRRGR